MVATPALASGSNGITERTQPTVSGDAGPPSQSGANGPPDHAKGNGAPNQGVDANQLTEEFSANTSLETLFKAAEQLAEFDPETEAERTALNETFTAMNGSMSEFRTIRGDADSEAAFEQLRDAQNQLSNLATESDDETLDNVSRLLYEASALAADRSIRDAKIAFERNEDAFPNHGQHRKTERAIDNANRALERGSDATSDDPPRRGPPGDTVEWTIENHANAITHHATAWRHAQRALETTAEHTEPTLTLRQRQTFEENGSIHVLLEVELTDVRAHEFDGADVHLEDGTVEPLEFDVQTRASTVRGVARIELGPEPKNETVTVTATSTADPDRSVEETTEIRIDEFDGDSLQRVLNLDIDRAHEFRLAAAQNHGQGLADVDDIDAFARHADNLQGIDGLNSGPVDDFIKARDSGNVQGALREVRRADEIGAENIQRMSLEAYNGKQRIGELDIQRTNEVIIESKSSFGYRPEEINTQFERKLRTMKNHDDVAFDGNTLEIRASQIGDEDLVQSKITEWEDRVANTEEWDNADVTIEVVDESTGTTITS